MHYSVYIVNLKIALDAMMNKINFPKEGRMGRMGEGEGRGWKREKESPLSMHPSLMTLSTCGDIMSSYNNMEQNGSRVRIGWWYCK